MNAIALFCEESEPSLRHILLAPANIGIVEATDRARQITANVKQKLASDEVEIQHPADGELDELVANALDAEGFCCLCFETIILETL